MLQLKVGIFLFNVGFSTAVKGDLFSGFFPRHIVGIAEDHVLS